MSGAARAANDGEGGSGGGGDALAAAAVGAVEPGMMVGLGSGRAARRAIAALGERAGREDLPITCVATSLASAELGESLGLTVIDMETVDRIDYLFDGADEVDPELRMIKGGGGAMTREKIVARASRRRVYIVGEEKLVPRLGTGFRLPIEVMRFGLAWVRRRLASIGLEGEIRRTPDGAIYLTDNDNTVLDAVLGEGLDIDEVARRVDAITGVVGHGLFLSEADAVLVERADGVIDELRR